MKKYPVLEGQIVERGIDKQEIAAKLGVSKRTMAAKLSGASDFKWTELQIMQTTFFPDISKEELMRTTRRDDVS